MPLNLAGVQRFVEGEMVDVVRITHDPQGTSDDGDFNYETGEWGGAAPPDSDIVYMGKAMVLVLNVFPSERLEGGGTTLSTDFELHIPLDAPKIDVDMDVLILQCDRTPHLVAEEFKIRALQDNTFSVSQVARIYNRKVRQPL